MNIHDNFNEWFIGWRPIGKPRAKPEFAQAEPFDSFKQASEIAAALNRDNGTHHHFVTLTVEAAFMGGRWDGRKETLSPRVEVIEVKDIDGTPYHKGMMALQEKYNVDFAKQGVPAHLEQEVSNLLEVCSVLAGIYRREGWDEINQRFIFHYEEVKEG